MCVVEALPQVVQLAIEGILLPDQLLILGLQQAHPLRERVWPLRRGARRHRAAPKGLRGGGATVAAVEGRHRGLARNVYARGQAASYPPRWRRAQPSSWARRERHLCAQGGNLILGGRVSNAQSRQDGTARWYGKGSAAKGAEKKSPYLVLAEDIVELPPKGLVVDRPHGDGQVGDLLEGGGL